MRDTLRVSDEADVFRASAFARVSTDLFRFISLDAALSYNYDRLDFIRKFPATNVLHTKSPQPQFMPRVAASFRLHKTVSLRAIVSKGYSPPSLQESRSSNNELNLALQPETGWNYESGIRISTEDRRFNFDVAAFYYELSDAIVRRLDTTGTEYFINSGKTFQPGLESQISYEFIQPGTSSFLRGFRIASAYTFYRFQFGDFNNGAADIQNRYLTGVPQHVSVTDILMKFPFDFYFMIKYNYTDQIPLNDLNTEYAKEYHLLQAKAGWQLRKTERLILDVNIGADNILNEKYSLGNDINAAGNRYYNAAPPANYFAKLTIGF
ncbi:MAG: TonB-dependent receptor [Bacteroidetes bacterium]|nr:TonB-dependent receptor [Bacteroidota bacterium]